MVENGRRLNEKQAVPEDGTVRGCGGLADTRVMETCPPRAYERGHAEVVRRAAAKERQGKEDTAEGAARRYTRTELTTAPSDGRKGLQQEELGTKSEITQLEKCRREKPWLVR